MKHLLAALALLASACASAPVVAETTADAPITFGLTHHLHSRVLGDEREINVWLPPDYAQGHDRYTVLYVLDGALDQDFLHIAGLGQLGALSYTYERLIVVGVQTKVRLHELTPVAHDQRYLSAFPQSGGDADFRRFLQTEVIPYVETTYRAGPRRALMGESLAGLFVVDTLLEAPTLFNDYVAISPSLWWDDRALARNASALLQQNNVSDRRLFIAVGDEGGTAQDGVDRLRAALAAAPQRVTLRYSDRSATETHATIYHGAALDALRWLYATPYDFGPAPWWMTDGASPPPTH